MATVSPSIAELRAAVSASLSSQGSQTELVDLVRTPSEYASTYPLEHLRIVLDDGTRRDLVFKNVSPDAVPASRRHAKPEFLQDPLREIDAYRLLATAPRFSMAAFCGATVDVERERYWLFLWDLSADELYKIGDFETWKDVARWLAQMHGGDERVLLQSRSHRWVNYDAAYFRLWAPRALEYCFSSASPQRFARRREFAALVANYDAVIARLAALPVTFIHGEFYPSNIMVSGDTGNRRVCPLDWEMAGIGPGLLDLAALTSGKWTSCQQEEMALAYFESLSDEERSSFSSRQAFLDALDDCRLHLALQWLGWSRNWIAPRDHAYDWFSEALRLGKKVGRQ
jgi:hypothetical protein